MKHPAAPQPLRTTLGAVLATLAVVLTLAAPAGAFRGGDVDDPARRNPVTNGETGETYLLNNGWDTTHDNTAVVGNHYDRVLTGDFNGDGKDTVAVRRGNTYALGSCTHTYGRVNDETLVGDFDGDGTDTLALHRGNTIIISNTPCSSRADRTLTYGRAGDVVLVGDWNGDGKDTFAVRRGNLLYIKNRLTGAPEITFTYGRASDTILVGDWNGDRKDTFAVRRGNFHYVRNALSTGPAHFTATYGRTTDAALVGDWNGDRKDTLGLRRRDPIPTPRNRPEQIAARYGMSVRYAPKDNLCGSGKVGCFGPALPYIWVSLTNKGAPRTAARIESTAWHESGHSLQYKACGTMKLPRVEQLADAIADRIRGARTRSVGVTADDQRRAAAIVAGRCPY